MQLFFVKRFILNPYKNRTNSVKPREHAGNRQESKHLMLIACVQLRNPLPWGKAVDDHRT